MEWNLIDIIQETDHRFLNYYTLVFDVLDDKNHTSKRYEYFMASRKSKEQLRCLTHDYVNPDGVLIPLYKIDEKTGEVFLLMTKQYRPPVGAYVLSITAGLIDKGEDIFEAARREALEEAGVVVTDMERLCPASASSTGMTDEMNAVVLARVVDFQENNLEEFEDITTKFYSLNEVKKMLISDEYLIPMSTRLLFLYLTERFKDSITR